MSPEQRAELRALADRVEKVTDEEAVTRDLLLEIFRAACPREDFDTGRHSDAARWQFYTWWERRR